MMISRLSKQLLHRVHGFTSTDRYYTPDGTGPSLNIDGMTFWCVIDAPRNFTTNDIQFIFGRSSWNESNRGWGFRSFTGTIRPLIDLDNTFSTIEQKTAQGCATNWGDANRLQVLHCVFINKVMYMYKNGCILGGNSVSGPGISKPSIVYSMPACGIGFGGYAGTQSQIKPFGGSIVACGICATTGLDPLEVRTHYLNIRNDVYSSAEGATHLWRAQDAGATWTDTISGLVATAYGSPQVTQKYYDFTDPYDYYYDYSLSKAILPQISNTAGNLRAWCIGDSRTAAPGSYRFLIEKVLKIGSPISNLNWVGRYPNPPSYYEATIGYSEQTNGMPGRSTGDCLYGSSGFGDFETEIANANPNIVIMWFGHNSADLEDQVVTKKNFRLLIGKSFIYNPNMRILLLSEVSGIREQGSQNTLQLDSKHTEINQYLVTEAAYWQSMGKHVYNCKIDDTVQWDNDSDWLDNAHPLGPSDPSQTGNYGYNKIAAKVWPCLLKLLGY